MRPHRDTRTECRFLCSLSSRLFSPSHVALCSSLQQAVQALPTPMSPWMTNLEPLKRRSPKLFAAVAPATSASLTSTVSTLLPHNAARQTRPVFAPSARSHAHSVCALQCAAATASPTEVRASVAFTAQALSPMARAFLKTTSPERLPFAVRVCLRYCYFAGATIV
jgi:hypothetical protein